MCLIFSVSWKFIKNMTLLINEEKQNSFPLLFAVLSLINSLQKLTWQSSSLYVGRNIFAKCSSSFCVCIYEIRFAICELCRGSFRTCQLNSGWLRSSTNAIHAAYTVLRRIGLGKVSAGLIWSKRARGYSNYSNIKRSRRDRIVSDKGYYRRRCHATRRFLQQSRLELADSKIFPVVDGRKPEAILPLLAPSGMIAYCGWDAQDLWLCLATGPHPFISTMQARPGANPLRKAGLRW